jgi:hypothetical protein
MVHKPLHKKLVDQNEPIKIRDQLRYSGVVGSSGSSKLDINTFTQNNINTYLGL